MELTITQNGALYFAHHKVLKRRAVLFWPLRSAARKQGRDVRDLGGWEQENRDCQMTSAIFCRRTH
jgi:hypothetical protein